jgi:hypothetical protein
MMRRNCSVVGLTLATLLTLPLAVAGQSADPWLGTWKLNLAQSKFAAGRVPPQGITLKIELVPGGAQKHTSDVTDAKGDTRRTEEVTNYDASDVSATPPHRDGETSAYRRLDDRSFEVIVRLNGQVRVTNRLVVSPDGKTMRQVTDGAAPGEPVLSNRLVYDKQ